MLDTPQQQKALHYGFRPSNTKISLGTPFDSAHGINVNQPSTLLQVPNADVVNAIENNWNQQRKRVDVMLVLDQSGSMNNDIGGTSKIEGAKQGLKEFVNLMSDNDQVGITTFSDQATELSSVSTLGPKRQDLLSQIDTISANGSTRLYDTIADESQAVASLPTKHIKALVVLTDGEDTASTLKLDQLINKIKATGKNAGNNVKIFTIAYGDAANGDGPDTTVLTSIVNSSGGQEYAGNPQNIKEVYNQISLFF